jgi:predicted RNase H-like HicB family nuclease
LVHAVNLGSVSYPITDDLRASYVIIHTDRHGHHVEHRRVAYDHAAVLERVARSGHPSTECLVSFQRGENIQFSARQRGWRAVRKAGPEYARLVARTVRLTAAVTPDGDWYVARCLDVEVASQGRTIDEALSNLREALELYFEDQPAPDAPEPIVAPVEVRLSA